MDTRTAASAIAWSTGGSGVISTGDVDWSTTTRLNEKRGVRLSLHAAHTAQGTPGF